jgi:hypothetical protein
MSQRGNTRSLPRQQRRRNSSLARRLIRHLGHGDPRCGLLPGGQAVRVYCPSCQPNGPRWPGDEPHLTIGLDQAGGVQ